MYSEKNDVSKFKSYGNFMPIVMQYILNDESYTIEANHFTFIITTPAFWAFFD